MNIYLPGLFIDPVSALVFNFSSTNSFRVIWRKMWGVETCVDRDVGRVPSLFKLELQLLSIYIVSKISFE